MNNGVLNYSYGEIVEIEDFNNSVVFIDQSPSEPFNLNEAGWPRNDISAYELASTEEEARLILQRLQEFNNDSIYDTMTEKEMFECVTPRRATSDPVLFSKFQEKLAELQYDRLKKQASDDEAAKLKAEQDERDFEAKVKAIASASNKDNPEAA